MHDSRSSQSRWASCVSVGYFTVRVTRKTSHSAATMILCRCHKTASCQVATDIIATVLQSWSPALVSLLLCYSSAWLLDWGVLWLASSSVIGCQGRLVAEMSCSLSSGLLFPSYATLRCALRGTVSDALNANTTTLLLTAVVLWRTTDTSSRWCLWVTVVDRPWLH